MINKFFTGLLLGTFVLFIPQVAKAENLIKHEFDFVMAHKSDNEKNVALIKEFSTNVFKRTNGAVKINPVNPPKIRGLLDNNILRHLKYQLYTGEIGMIQMSVKKFVNDSTTIDALDMPMVFRDHAHVEKVLDGPIGKQLIEDLYIGSDGQIQGLDFTYSGGFRNYYTVGKEINSVADLKGMSIRTRGNRTSRGAAYHLGLVQNQGIKLNWSKAHLDNKVMAEEAETLRLLSYNKESPEAIKHVKTVLVTNHSVYLTLLSINGPLFKKLTTDQQVVLKEEARALAEKERTLSIQQGIDGRKMFEEKGIKFINLSEEDKKLLEEMGHKVHKKYEGQKVGDVIKAIIATK